MIRLALAGRVAGNIAIFAEEMEAEIFHGSPEHNKLRLTWIGPETGRGKRKVNRNPHHANHPRTTNLGHDAGVAAVARVECGVPCSPPPCCHCQTKPPLEPRCMGVGMGCLLSVVCTGPTPL